MSDKDKIDTESNDDFDGDLPELVTDEEFDPDDLEGGDETGEPPAEEEEEEEDDEEGGTSLAAGQDDDEDEPDPGEVEADLDEILRDRIAASDDDDDDEEEGAVVSLPPPGDVEGRRESEIHCPNCFLLVTTNAVTDTGECPHCGSPIS